MDTRSKKQTLTSCRAMDTRNRIYVLLTDVYSFSQLFKHVFGN